MIQDIVRLAVDFWREGLTPLPSGVEAFGGGKAPCVKGGWKEWQTKRQADENEVREMFAGAKGMGLVCSGALLVIDIDHDEDGAKFAAFRAATDGIKYALDKTPHGMHVLVRCEEDFGKTKSATGDILSGGRSFVRVYGDPGPIPWVTAEEARRLVAAGNGSRDGKTDDSPADSMRMEEGRETHEKSPHTLAAMMAKDGWVAKGKSASGWTNLVNGTKTAAISPDGSSVKMFSTSLWGGQGTGNGEQGTGRTPDIYDSQALKGEYPEVPEPLIEGLLRRGETMLLFGKPKVQKSIRCLALADAVSRGGTWAGFKCKQGKVLVIDNETHPALLSERYEKIRENGLRCQCQRNPPPLDPSPEPRDPIPVDFMPVWDREYSVEDMMMDAERLKGYDLIIFDILARGLPEWCESESDNRQCAKVWGCVQKTAAATGAAIVVVHHARKSTTADIVSDPSGAGWTRYASTIASVTRKSGEPGVWLEATCRSFPSPQARRM